MSYMFQSRRNNVALIKKFGRPFTWHAGTYSETTKKNKKTQKEILKRKNVLPLNVPKHNIKRIYIPLPRNDNRNKQIHEI